MRIQLTTAWYLRSKSTVAVLLMTWPGSNACTRPRGEQAIPSSQTSSQLGTVAVSRSPATSTWTPLMKSDPRQSVAKIIPTRCCAGGVEHNLEQSHWFEAVAQACYQGSSLYGPIRVESVSRNRTVAIDVPPQLRNNCSLVPPGSIVTDVAHASACRVQTRLHALRVPAVATLGSRPAPSFTLLWTAHAQRPGSPETASGEGQRGADPLVRAGPPGPAKAGTTQPSPQASPQFQTPPGLRTAQRPR